MVPARPSLNVIDIVTSTFSVYWRGLFYFLPAILLFTVAFEAVSAEISGVIARSLTPTIWLNLALSFGEAMVNLLYGLCVQALVVLPAIHLFRDGRIGVLRSTRRLLLLLAPMVALCLIIPVVTMLGFILLFVPGVIISLMLFVAMPVLLDEQVGLRAIPRSMNLTRDYRWALLGLSILTTLIVFILAFLASFIMTPGALWLDSLEIGNPAIRGLLRVSVTAFGLAIIAPVGGISAAIAYVRLKEIKEGGASETLRKVFE
ncbi:hypothetical protein [Hyphobacterium sp.]|uniref:hypothetical protein n=1 Tax=Hyphobacterium sp. TaxID=2004662 RepID=UPI0037490CBA